jgi:vacuolar iron transporter family protein
MPDLRSIQTEVDAGYLYGKLADKEEDKNVADIFQQMSAIEKAHAEAFLRPSGPKH